MLFCICSEQDLNTCPFLSADPQAPFYFFVFCTPSILPAPPPPSPIAPEASSPGRAAPTWQVRPLERPRAPAASSPLLCSGGRGCIWLAVSSAPAGAGTTNRPSSGGGPHPPPVAIETISALFVTPELKGLKAQTTFHINLKNTSLFFLLPFSCSSSFKFGTRIEGLPDSEIVLTLLLFKLRGEQKLIARVLNIMYSSDEHLLSTWF